LASFPKGLTFVSMFHSSVTWIVRAGQKLKLWARQYKRNISARNPLHMKSSSPRFV
jgi:hypothetical protein